MNIDALVAIDSVIPCGLLLNELVSTALKHAFPGGRSGVVRVGFRREGEDYDGDDYEEGPYGPPTSGPLPA